MANKAYTIVAEQFGEVFSNLVDEIRRRDSEGLPPSWNRVWEVTDESKKEDSLIMGMSGLPRSGPKMVHDEPDQEAWTLLQGGGG